MKRFITMAVSIVALATTTLPAQEIYGEPDAPLVAEVLGTKIHTSDPDEMQYVILGHLLNRYASDKNIEVQQGEIDAYVEIVRRAAEQDRREREARRDELARKLESKGFSDAERQAVSSELAILNDLLGMPGGRESGGEESQEDKEARQEVATAFIRQWKINRALYQQYGGRVIFQQGGPEPLDAYRKFLEERQEQGAFKIFDESFESAFWRYYVTDSIHSFYPAGSKEEPQAFDAPWWLTEQPEAAQ